MERLALTYKEYWGYYWRITSRHQIPGIFKWDEDLVSLIEKACVLKPGAEVLDLGCAGGDQVKVFAKKGYRVTGMDYVPSLIDYAREAFAKEGLGGDFSVGDMRDIDYENKFDLVTILSGTFGYFSDVQNQEMLGKIHRALKPGGYAFIDYLPLEDFAARRPARNWHPIDGGYGLNEEWFDVLTSTHRTRNTHILLEGRIIEGTVEEDGGANEILRCYSAREMETLAGTAGFTVTAHLNRYNLENPDRQPLPGEPRGMIALKKGGGINA
jgi:SAM-dependent methyltransferase